MVTIPPDVVLTLASSTVFWTGMCQQLLPRARTYNLQASSLVNLDFEDMVLLGMAK